MKGSKIEWTHHTFNPWWGCERISPGCANCYAETWAKRCGHAIWGRNAPRRFFGDKHWNEPLKWNAAAQAAGRRERVFCASMADVFEDRSDLVEPRMRLLQLIDDTREGLAWLLLTKRPENIQRLMDEAMHGNFDRMRTFAEHMPNVWLGTTVENQKEAEIRIPILARIEAKVRFLSCEPLLGPVDLSLPSCAGHQHSPFNWVICGGESGGSARPMQPAWACSLRDQCRALGVPFLFKQWGNFRPNAENPQFMDNVGKKAAGRLLDGKTFDEFPDS